MMPSDEPLIRVDHLKKYFSGPKRFFSNSRSLVKAVDGVSFEVGKAETLGLVGESGCGKSTTGRCVLRLIEPTAGRVVYQDTELTGLSPSRLRAYRRHLQIIFQDPMSSLNPRLTIDAMLREILKVHGIAEGHAATKRIAELMTMVGLPADDRYRFPHEFSGGQRQRIGIARALAVEASFIVCDEPVSALDVSIQAQIVNLLSDLQKNLSLAYLFIAHDLAVVRHICDRVAVMYLGRIVEMAETQELFTHPRHPYTQALMQAAPIPDPEIHRTRTTLNGEVPSAAHPPSGCPFHPRCAYVRTECLEMQPDLIEAGQDHLVSCHFPI
jgi:oligopeptide transport system ATP-binding protein